MSSRFRLPAGRSYNVRASELARDRQHTEVLCNVILLDNTIQPFKVNVSNIFISSSCLRHVNVFVFWSDDHHDQIVLLNIPAVGGVSLGVPPNHVHARAQQQSHDTLIFNAMSLCLCS